MITFQYPIAWLLILPLLVLWLRRPLSNRIANAIRIITTILIVAIIAKPSIKREDTHGCLVTVVDRSASMPEKAENQALQFIKELDREKPPKSNHIVLSFSQSTQLEKSIQGNTISQFSANHKNQNASNLANAIQVAAASIPPDTPARILLVTDGNWNGPDPTEALTTAAVANIPVDCIILKRNTLQDLAIVNIVAPSQVAENEAFPITTIIDSPQRTEAVLTTKINQSQPSQHQIELRKGLNTISRWHISDKPEILDIRIGVSQINANDFPQNNHARQLVQIAERKQILHFSNASSSNFATSLSLANFPVVTLKPSKTILTPDFLARFNATIIENIPASAFDSQGLELLAELVKSGSMGLVMTGGKTSFGAGGYYNSPLEDVIAVDLEQRDDIRKSTVGMVIALDRSGSMAAQLPNSSLRKMDLANRGTLEVFHLLNPKDELGVLAVDTEAHVVLDMLPVSKHGGAEEKIMGIESGGGGIFIEEALARSLYFLVHSNAATRHAIIFADAADSEQPGNYVELLLRAVKEDITVSVIALGSETDIDAKLLKDIARLGNGICHFAQDPAEIPKLFVEDTFAMTKQPFIKQETKTSYTQAYNSFAIKKTDSPPIIGGYNLTFPKRSGETLILTDDENKAPVAAIANVNLGRSAALTAEADGPNTGQLATHQNTPQLLAGLLNWTLPLDNQNQNDFVVTQSTQNATRTVNILLDPDRTKQIFPTKPKLINVIQEETGKISTQTLDFNWKNPDKLTCEHPLYDNAIILSTIALDANRSMPIPPVALPLSAEFTPPPRHIQPIQQLCKSITKGKERIDVQRIWNELPPKKRLFDLTPILASLAIALLLLEIAQTKFAFLKIPAINLRNPLPRLRRKSPRTQSPPEQQPAIPQPPSAPQPTEKTPRQPPDQPQPQNELSDALKKAKRF